MSYKETELSTDIVDGLLIQTKTSVSEYTSKVGLQVGRIESGRIRLWIGNVDKELSFGGSRAIDLTDSDVHYLIGELKAIVRNPA